MSHLPWTLRQLRRGLRRVIFRGEFFGAEPSRASRALAFRLSGGVEHSSLIRCRCGELLTAVVGSDREHLEIISLGCPKEHGFIPCWSGVLVPTASQPEGVL
jgi:hypothetical protein